MWRLRQHTANFRYCGNLLEIRALWACCNSLEHNLPRNLAPKADLRGASLCVLGGNFQNLGDCILQHGSHLLEQDSKNRHQKSAKNAKLSVSLHSDGTALESIKGAALTVRGVRQRRFPPASTDHPARHFLCSTSMAVGCSIASAPTMAEVEGKRLRSNGVVVITPSQPNHSGNTI